MAEQVESSSDQKVFDPIMFMMTVKMAPVVPF